MKYLIILSLLMASWVNIYAQCTPEVELSADENPICSFTTTTFTATPIANAGTAPTYTFTSSFFGEIQSGTSNTATPTFIFDGEVITVDMKPTDGCADGQTASDQVSMTTVTAPSPSINEPSSSICDGNSYEFTALVTDGNTYEWYLDGNPTGNMTKTMNATVAGDYTIIEDNGGCPPETSDPKSLSVLANPIVNAGDDIVVAPGSSGMINGFSDYTTNISWTPTTYLDDPNSLTPICSPPLDGNTTTYTLTSFNGQCSASDQMTVLVSFVTSYEEYVEEERGIYPNPANEMINLPESCKTYEIYNAEGTLVKKGMGTISIVKDLPKGLYHVMINKGNTNISKSFTIAR